MPTDEQIEAAAWVWAGQFPDPDRKWNDVLVVTRAALEAAEQAAPKKRRKRGSRTPHIIRGIELVERALASGRRADDWTKGGVAVIDERGTVYRTIRDAAQTRRMGQATIRQRLANPASGWRRAPANAVEPPVRGIFAEVAEIVGTSPQQLHAAWRRYERDRGQQ